jgi:hypothetical protein
MPVQIQSDTIRSDGSVRHGRGFIGAVLVFPCHNFSLNSALRGPIGGRCARFGSATLVAEPCRIRSSREIPSRTASPAAPPNNLNA